MSQYDINIYNAGLVVGLTVIYAAAIIAAGVAS